MTAELRPYSRLVAALFGTLKLMQMYGRRHDTAADAAENLTAAVRDAAAGEDEVTVGLRGARLQVNGRLMRPTDCGNLALSFLADEWIRRRIRAIHIDATVTAAHLSEFATDFLELDTSRPEPAERLAAALSTAGVKSIRIEPREEKEEEPIALEDRREAAMRSYLRGLRAFRELLRCQGFSDRRLLRRARHAVQGLVDRFLEDEAAVLALAQIRGHDVKLFHHSLHVCIYALALGQRLGLNRRQLGALGLSALFHDVGKTVPPAPGAPPESPWDELRLHPLRGALLLFQEGSSHEGMLKAAIAAYEHHVHHDGGGFPAVEHAPHLVSRIVAIADCYEALTSPRDYRERAFTATEAMALLAAKSGTNFDPLLLRVFEAALGAYPIGSLVELDSGEIAIVVAAPREPRDRAKPQVRVVASASGTRAPGTILDLAAQAADGESTATIVRVVPQGEVFADARAFVEVI